MLRWVILLGYSAFIGYGGRGPADIRTEND